MNNKTKMSNLEAYQELSIQITCLDMKLNKILELLNKPEIPDLAGKSSAEVIQEAWVTAPQWPNESHTNYLKRIGQYNEAQSADEEFGEEFK